MLSFEHLSLDAVVTQKLLFETDYDGNNFTVETSHSRRLTRATVLPLNQNKQKTIYGWM